MPITGSQSALMQNRAGASLERAPRSNESRREVVR